MKLIDRFFSRNWIFLLILTVITIPALFPLFQPGYFSTQDYIYIARIFEMRQALGDGHFPVRWVPDFRYGEPLYNFYGPLPYYLAALIRIVSEYLFITLSYLNVTKIIFAIGFLFSAFSMFFLGKALFGKWAGLTSAVLYLYAPYHSVDLYVRGAISEAYALIIFPIIYLTIMRYGQTRNLTWFAGIILSISSLFYTHNIMTVLFSPFILLWMGYWILKSKGRLLLPLGFSFVWGVALAASYLLPAFFEKQYIQSEGLTSGYFDFRGHFISISQWIVPSWGYGASLWGDEDGMSFQLGVVHWATIFLVFLSLFLLLIRKRISFLSAFLGSGFYQKKTELKWLFVLVAVLSFGLFFSLFMTHVRSAFIWEQFSILAFTQFPWRFLGISIFFGSLFGGLLLYLLKEKMQVAGAIVISVLALFFYIGYFQVDIYYFDAVDEGYIGKETLTREDKLPRDYLPKTVKSVQRERLEEPQFRQGDGVITNFRYQTAKVSFSVNVAESPATIEVPSTYFPGWKVRSDSQVVTILEPDEYGLIRLQFDQTGPTNVVLTFEDTLVRRIGNIITLLSAGGLLGLVYFRRRDVKK